MTEDNNNNNNQHKFMKGKDGFKIETTDPIQDIMEDEELSEAEKRLESLLGDD